MWGGAARVPEPEEFEGLTGMKFPLNSAPMGATPLGFLMRRNKRVAVATGYSPSTPIITPTHLHLFSSLSCLSLATLSPLLGVMGPSQNTTIAPIRIAGLNSAILIRLLQTSWRE